jgi:hypothetical protein
MKEKRKKERKSGRKKMLNKDRRKEGDARKI